MNEPNRVHVLAAAAHWSDYRDPRSKRTVREEILAASESIQHRFWKLLARVVDHATRHETVSVSWWYETFVYVGVRDDRWKHYPCRERFLVSFDLANGRIASPSSKNRYVYARKRWGPFADRLVRRPVPRYSQCASPEATRHC